MRKRSGSGIPSGNPYDNILSRAAVSGLAGGGDPASLAIRTESPTEWVSVREEAQRNGRELGCIADRREGYGACDDEIGSVFFRVFLTRSMSVQIARNNVTRYLGLRECMQSYYTGKSANGLSSAPSSELNGETSIEGSRPCAQDDCYCGRPLDIPGTLAMNQGNGPSRRRPLQGRITYRGAL